jgi:glutamate racemase
MDKRPVGIFDSGLGGLTVFKQIANLISNEDLIYLGDNARVPYGSRSKETVIRFSFEDANFLLSKNVKCIVIACNTSSAFAGSELKKKLKIPIFDVITPAVSDAVKLSRNGKIGVIGTRGTISSNAYQDKLKIACTQRGVNSKLKIYSQACPLFVPFIEEGEFKSRTLEMVARDYLSDLRKDKIDTLIMGCTHYPIIKDIIAKEVDNHVKLVDPGKAVAEELLDYLTKNKMLSRQDIAGKRNYFVTDYTDRFIKVAEMFLGHKIECNLRKVLL